MIVISIIQCSTASDNTVQNIIKKNSGKNNNNNRLIKPNCKTNIITDEVMDFMEAIVNISKTLEKSPGKASGH